MTTITKPNANYTLIEKDLKAICQLFNVQVIPPGNSSISMYDRIFFTDLTIFFDGKAIDAKTKDPIFFQRAARIITYKYTTRCRSEFMFLADVDGEECWLLPDENYNFDIIYEIN